MRQLTLHNNKTKNSIKLYDNSTLVSDFTGFGSKYEIKQAKTIVSEITPVFERITLDLYFGINGNAYNDYKALMVLIGSNEKGLLTLEYNYGDGSRYCDVILDNAPKTQKNIYGVLKESFVFVRTTAWYEIITINTPFAGGGDTFNLPSNETPYVFPIRIEFFVVIDEPSDIGKLIDIEYSYKNKFSETIARVNYVGISDAMKTVVIDAETKTVESVYSNNAAINNYDKINKNYQTFLYIKPGDVDCSIGTDSSGSTAIVGNGKMIIKKWLVD